jgi:hypothetical protein
MSGTLCLPGFQEAWERNGRHRLPEGGNRSQGRTTEVN